MKITVHQPVEIEVDAIRVRLPLRYDEDREQLRGLHCVSGNRLTLTLGLDGRARGWPAGTESAFHLKVVDEGAYDLLDATGAVVVTRDDCYVPSAVPGEYGDYFVCRIDGAGQVFDEDGDPWRPTAKDVESAFFGGGE